MRRQLPAKFLEKRYCFDNGVRAMGTIRNYLAQLSQTLHGTSISIDYGRFEIPKVWHF